MAKKKEVEQERSFSSALDKWKKLKRARMASEMAMTQNIPLQIWELDNLILGGGLPRGFMTEISGESATCKTTLSLQAVAAAQRAGEEVVFVDLEGRFDPVWANIIGINLEKLVYLSPASGEEAYSAISDFIGVSGLIVVDSIAGMVPESEMQKGFDDPESMASRAKLNNRALKRLVFGAGNGIKLRDTQTAIFLMNQIYDNIGVMYGAKTKTSGGRGPEYNSQVRLRSSRKEVDENLADFTIKCTKIGAALPVPFQKVIIRLDMTAGFFWPCDMEKFIEDCAAQKKYDCEISGRNVKFKGENYIGKPGRAKLARVLRDDYSLVDEVMIKPKSMIIATEDREFEEEEIV